MTAEEEEEEEEEEGIGLVSREWISIVGHRIVGTAFADPNRDGGDWGDHDVILLTLDDGRTYSIHALGYDASGLVISKGVHHF